MGELLCICDRAVATDVCESCDKGSYIKPTRTYCWPMWPRRTVKWKELKRLRDGHLKDTKG